MRRLPQLLGWGVALLCFGVGGGGTPVCSTPSLYELTAHADLVVAAQVVAGSLKRAKVVVGEVFRGEVEAGDLLRISFRDLNARLSKSERIVFEDGEKDILFLTPEQDSRGEPKGKSRFTLYRGHHGKVLLPREGEDAYLEAMRTFSNLVEQKDHRKLYDEIRALIGRANPLLVEAGLEEVFRLQIMEPEMIPSVLPLLRDPAPRRRAVALQLFVQLFERPEGPGAVPGVEETVLGPIRVLARNDPDEGVRVAAVTALGAWGGEEVDATLREIAQQDPAQAVRYEAQLILLRRSGREGPAGSQP